jgi:signal transduction histidine kinase
MTDAPADDKWPRLLSLSVHEFRTPISVVAGYLRMVLKDPAGTLDERYRRWLEEGEKSCGRLAALAAEMSELSSLETRAAPFSRAPIDLHALLANAIAELPEVPDRNIVVEFTPGHEPVAIQGDAARLKTAFTSVLHALRREVVAGDRLFVNERAGTYQGKPASWIAIAERTQIEALTAATPESLTTFDEWRGGCGLSLVLARRIIEGHGGAMWSPEEGAKGGALIVLSH